MLSPMGWYYKFDPLAPPGERLVRKRQLNHLWSVEPINIQHMTPDELRFIARLMDEARV